MTFVAAPLEAADGHHGYSSPRGDGADNLVVQNRKAGQKKGGNAWEAEEPDVVNQGPAVASPLSHGSNPNSNMAGRRREDDENLVSFDAEQSYQEPDELAYLTRKLRRAVSSESTGVRRLTPRECERLQALPDNWTAHGPDSRRYAALGDAVTASVSEWIGRRLVRAL